MGRNQRRRSTPTPTSVPQGASVALARPAAISLWILDPWRDLLLFVATPLLILPVFFLAREQWSVEEIALFVAAFGALGHHLPGMIRAYGDRQLFQRFKTRFIVAPLFLAGVCTLFALEELNGMILVAALWGVWHGMAQTYGFVRIYDAKYGCVGPLTARLDFAMCIAWFGVGLLLSPGRLYDMVHRFYTLGGPLLPEAVFSNLRTVWAWGTGAVTLVFLLHALDSWRQGRPPSPIKILLMATSFGFWWYTSITVANLLVGVALFEIFHDVQYLSIVWIYNRNRVEKNPGIAHFMRFLFRRSGALMGVYVGLVFAYGSLDLVARGLPMETVQDALKGVLVASALLHFYYDGFIWKVRERSTRESLGLAGGEKESRESKGLPDWLPHGMKWALFALPVAWLGITEARSMDQPFHSELTLARALVAAAPSSPDAHRQLGEALLDVGRLDAAQEHLHRALELDPEFAEAHNSLSLLWAERGDLEREVFHLEEAVKIKPEYAEAHNNLGVALSVRGDLETAIHHYEEALRLKPGQASTHNNLALALAAQGRLDEAIHHFQEALAIQPDFPEVEQALRGARALQERRGLE